MTRRKRKNLVRLEEFGDNFIRREILQAMDTVARKNNGIIKITHVHQELHKRGWAISYTKLSKLVKTEIIGTGWRLFGR